MKTYPTVILIVSILIATGFGIASSNERPAADSPTVLGIHHLTLKEGVSAQELERFVIEEAAPIINKHLPITRWTVMKGKRGSRTNEYVSVYEFNSEHARSTLWNEDGSSTDLYNQVWGQCSECQEVERRWYEMVEEVEYTDYVEVNRAE